MWRCVALLVALAAAVDCFTPSHPAPLRGLVATKASVTLEGRPISGALEPLSNFVLVEVREAAAQTTGGIVLPDQAKEKPTEGVVIAVGPGKIHHETTVQLPMCVSAGQRVLYGKYDGSKLEYNGKDHTLVRDDDILLVFEGDEMTLDSVAPASDRLIVKVEKEGESTTSGIVMAPTGGDSNPSEGQVIMVGPGRVSSKGEVMPVDIEVGEFVKFRDYAGSPVRIKGEEYFVVRAAECLAKWK